MRTKTDILFNMQSRHILLLLNYFNTVNNAHCLNKMCIDESVTMMLRIIFIFYWYVF